ncbi:MAG TPA: nitrilase-related carbon-nitrogen hydrolase [Puia sp.]|nr:nitrilase-related carbon-nitrogen hydrolase [Puia sp.]
MLQISVVQFTPTWGHKAQNLEQIRQLLTGLRSDMVILPELCTTGYSFLSKEEVRTVAEDASGQSIGLLKKLARENNALIIAGFAEIEGENVYNSAVAVFPGGDTTIYRKSHLFYREKLCFAPGNTGFTVIKHPLHDCNVGIMICNDWRYPEAARSLALAGADIIACPSNLVTNLWTIGMPARALENKVYVAVANRCGTEERDLPSNEKQALTFKGCSAIYDLTGLALATARENEDAILTVEIDPVLARDKSFNDFNDLFNDRRPDLYRI